MTDTNIQNLLSPEEISALLRSGRNDAEPMTSVLNANGAPAKDAAAAENAGRALLAEYLVKAEIIPCGRGVPRLEPPFLQARLSSARGDGYILFSAAFAETLVTRILAGRNAPTAGQNLITPAAAAVMREAAVVICRAAAEAFAPQAGDAVWRCSDFSAREQNFAGEGLPFRFSLDGADMWLLPPEPEFLSRNAAASPDESAALRQAAHGLPLEAAAVVGRKKVTLRELSRWQVGNFLPLGIEKNAEISILCGNKTLFKGVLGQKLRRAAVKITKKVPWK